MVNDTETKDDLIIQIKHLIDITGEETQINPKFLDLFEYDELVDIRDNLENKQTHQDQLHSEYLDQIYNKCK